jgi:hypothetical protein
LLSRRFQRATPLTPTTFVPINVFNSGAAPAEEEKVEEEEDEDMGFSLFD